ncbi:MAG: geranylgeranyl reductase family protein [Nitrososphaerales archaeon]|nr:geranylgeranyl reductase family protein [Nitrososphaerales archaeon]
MSNSYDVAVVGAGVAGCIVSSLLAKRGFKVCIIDAKGAEGVGSKVCGDALIGRGLDLVGFEPPASVITNISSAIRYYAPGIEPITLKTKIFLLDRSKFGQFLLQRAMDNGAVFMEKCRATAPILEGGKVAGINARLTGAKAEFHAKLVIDASGVSEVIRRRLPKDWWVSKPVERRNIALCYREVRRLRGEKVDSKICRVFHDRGIIPSGYYWIFPKNDNLVNVGLGARLTTMDHDIKGRLYRHVLSNSIFKDSEILAQGFGLVPVGPPLDCFLASGFITIGDAAGQVSPFTADGMRPSIISAHIAAEAIAKAEGFDLDRLWCYNIDFMRELGKRHAELAAFGAFFEGLDYGSARSLLSIFGSNAYDFGDFEDFKIGPTLVFKSSLRGFGRLDLMLREYRVVKSARSLYRDYPTSPSGFLEWSERAERFWKGHR